MRLQRGFRIAALGAVAWLGLTAAPEVHAQAGTPAARSAQSDCQREAARRGYTVLATRNYQQYKDGWSLDIQARDYAGRVSWGSCFVETRTGDVSLYGFGWGNGGSSGGGGSSGSPFEFNCASVEGKYRECQLPVNGRARLVKQKSDAPCVEGRSWGQRGDRVWVDNGCRAKFEVVRTGGGTGGGGANTGQQQRAEARCRDQASREGVSVRNVAPAQLRATYWETTVLGTRGGTNVRAICRFYPSSNRAQLFYGN